MTDSTLIAWTLIAAGSWFISALLIGTLIGKFIKAGKARSAK